ncbi:unnamed protein product, partial [marine sediment metagenome]
SSNIILPLDMNSTVNAILKEACQYAFHEDFKSSLLKFLPGYINYLAYKIEKERKLLGISSKLEGIIWQDIPEILQKGISKPSQYQYIGEGVMNYYLDTGILDVLRPYLASKPDSIYKKINQSLNEKKFGVALELVDSAIKPGKNDLDLVIYKAMILSNLNRNKESLEFLNDQIEVSQIDKNNQLYALYFFVLGFSSMTLGDYEKAFDIVKNVSKLYPDHPISHALKAVINGYNRIYGFD